MSAPQTAAVEAPASGRETREGVPNSALPGQPAESTFERTVRMAVDIGEAKVRLIHARAVLKRPHDGSCAAWASLEADCDCWWSELQVALDGELH